MEERHAENTACVLGLQWDSSGCSVDGQADLVMGRLPAVFQVRVMPYRMKLSSIVLVPLAV